VALVLLMDFHTEVVVVVVQAESEQLDLALQLVEQDFLLVLLELPCLELVVVAEAATMLEEEVQEERLQQAVAQVVEQIG
jgi:hypothetical protein